jgi:hypothetical protein
LESSLLFNQEPVEVASVGTVALRQGNNDVAGLESGDFEHYKFQCNITMFSYVDEYKYPLYLNKMERKVVFIKFVFGKNGSTNLHEQ